jgi:hypothetical protein
MMLAAVAVIAVIVPSSNAVAEQRLMQCDSNGYRYQYCNADTQGRVILLREKSTGNLCRQGRGWGFDNNGIWVDKGCRGEFSYGRDDGGGGGSWDRPGKLTCESIGYRHRYCNANTQDRVSLVREISTGNLCRQGSGWGYDSGGIWVDKGCRGEFQYGRDSSRRNDAAIAAGILGAFALGAAISSSQQAAPRLLRRARFPLPSHPGRRAPIMHGTRNPGTTSSCMCGLRAKSRCATRLERSSMKEICAMAWSIGATASSHGWPAKAPA